MIQDPIDLLFRAFSDRTRLRILHLLKGRETCVGDLVEILQLSQPTASRHLAYLRKAHLVDVRKDGLWCFYSLSKPTGKFHGRLLDCIGCCFDEVPEIAADAKRAAKLAKLGGCCPTKR